MFILTKIADLVQIQPADFQKDAAHAIEDNINAKYANKVIQKIGLCICLYDLLSASDGLIGHGNGLVNVNVEFRIIVFRPFKHEVLLGKISSSVDDAIRLRLPFFDDISIPKENLPEGTYFDHAEQLFVWPTDPTDPTSSASRLFFDNHETVRFRVEGEIWTDSTPLNPSDVHNNNKENDGAGAGAGTNGTNGSGAGGGGGGGAGMSKQSPYRLIGTMADAGLGPCLWWDGDDDDEEVEEAGQ